MLMMIVICNLAAINLRSALFPHYHSENILWKAISIKNEEVAINS